MPVLHSDSLCILKIINFENTNTMFLVDFEGTQKCFRLVYDIIHGDAWLDEEYDDLAMISDFSSNNWSQNLTYLK